MGRLSRADLEQRLEWRKNDVKSLQGRVDRLEAFLGHLYELEPAVRRFSTGTLDSFDEAWDWDFDGVRKAAEHRKNERIADKYTPKTVTINGQTLLAGIDFASKHSRDCE